jgi:hypothetical protein
MHSQLGHFLCVEIVDICHTAHGHQVYRATKASVPELFHGTIHIFKILMRGYHKLEIREAYFFITLYYLGIDSIFPTLARARQFGTDTECQIVPSASIVGKLVEEIVPNLGI